MEFYGFHVNNQFVFIILLIFCKECVYEAFIYIAF